MLYSFFFLSPAQFHAHNGHRAETSEMLWLAVFFTLLFMSHFLIKFLLNCKYRPHRQQIIIHSKCVRLVARSLVAVAELFEQKISFYFFVRVEDVCAKMMSVSA